ncbi:hypothetical protein ACFL3V_00530 [Nanoarchaeota archaeon]
MIDDSALVLGAEGVVRDGAVSLIDDSALVLGAYGCVAIDAVGVPKLIHRFVVLDGTSLVTDAAATSNLNKAATSHTRLA